jgi:two-component system, response regulator PdtaR
VPRTNPTVLIVEDEVILRIYAAELAEGAGFSTLEAGNAEDALRQLEDLEQVEILLTDVNMPGSIDGLELASIVRQRWPEIKVIIASGRPDTRDAVLQSETRFVSKPFTSHDLIAALIDAV